MPFWVSILVTLALKFGLPWLLKRFPWIPVEVREIVEDAVKKVNELKRAKEEAIQGARERAKECYGTGCPPNTIRE